MDEYEDDGTWVWVSYASECRLVLAHVVGERKQYAADKLIKSTKDRLASIPLFVSDGLKFYATALLNAYGKLKKFPPTGRRGRPRKPKIVPHHALKYARVIKHRENGRLRRLNRNPSQQA
jgi:hypothetical protein